MPKPSIHPIAPRSAGISNQHSNSSGWRKHSSSSGITQRAQPIRRQSGIGSEPGINPRDDDKYSHFSEKCAIQVTDFSSEHVLLNTLSNAEFVELMKHGPPKSEQPAVAPEERSLRWINIGGISWDVLSALALRYDLHPLALEDILHEQGHNQSKADYYRQHLFLRVLCHSIPTEQDRNAGPDPKSEYPGTVISIRPTPNLEFTEPVTERMHQHDSVIRTSEDPAILFESLLDLIVDRILEVMDQYQDKIHQLEHDILMKPGMSTVRSLHILSGDLIMHKRTLEPIKSMLYGLRRYDQDRCAAIGLGNDLPANRRQVHVDLNAMDSGLGVGVGAAAHSARGGYLSYNAKIYLADVYDHIDFVLTSLDMFAGISENLINYAFNMASYEMNVVMRRLTLATIIFLPLTLLTGYFLLILQGMNFKSMWSVNNNSDLLFWIIALPLMGLIIPMFLYADIKSMVHYVHKVMAARRAVLAQEGASW
ncbi:CorA-like protein [Mycena sanguinolenta]|uniref:CorA-like protein n=1 Tax=Mycena sanguinolenta TaxID=230812 RepID=A0A8H6YJJ2_9AGAR|nr:CorA-like protein [Mycena sanguinolenta]